MTAPRRIRLTHRAPGSATVREQTVETHCEDGKVRLVVLKTNDHMAGDYLAMRSRDCPESWYGAAIIVLPPGSEFEVWEEP